MCSSLIAVSRSACHYSSLVTKRTHAWNYNRNSQSMVQVIGSAEYVTVEQP